MTPPASRSRTTTTEPGVQIRQATTAEFTAEVMAALRAPFPPEVVGKLPRVTCRACSKSDSKRCDNHGWVSGCPACHGNHSEAAMHIDYVGHAAVTDRLLAVDPEWTWEPMGYSAEGYPALDGAGQLWIWLTIKGVRRPGVGDTSNDSSGSKGKVLVGDALRNAAMRFGVALDLWSKQDLSEVNPVTDPIFLRMMLDNIEEASTVEALREIGMTVKANAASLSKEDRAVVNEAWIARRDKMGQKA